MLQEWLNAQLLPDLGHTTRPQVITSNQAIPLAAIQSIHRSQTTSPSSTKSTDTMLGSSHVRKAATSNQLGSRITPEFASAGVASDGLAPLQPDANDNKDNRDEAKRPRDTDLMDHTATPEKPDGLAPLQPDDDDNKGNRDEAKRPRDTDSMDHMTTPEKPAKTARLEYQGGVERGYAYWLHGLMRSHDKDASTAKEATVARGQAVSEVQRQQKIIGAMQTDQTEFKAKNKELDEKNRGLEEKSRAMSVERESKIQLAEVKRLDSERRSLHLEQEVARMKKELETAKSDLEKIRGKAAEFSQAEIEKMREGDRATIERLKSELQEMDGQLVAGAKNTAHYRNEERKAQDSLLKSQSQNTRLVGRVDELTTTHEYDVI
jgi:hypothetical protein